MDGLKNMGTSQGDSEVVDIVLNTVLNRLNLKSWDYQNVVASLIIGYSSDMRMKELAKRELFERDSSYTAIALVYGGDEEIRKNLRWPVLCQFVFEQLLQHIFRRKQW